MRIKDVPTNCYILHHHSLGDRFGKFLKYESGRVFFAATIGTSSETGHSYFFTQSDLDDDMIGEF